MGSEAMEEIVRLHAASVYRIVASHVGPGEAEDATQEVFVQIQQGLRTFEGRSQLSTWIFRIATNVALKRLRRRKRKPPLASLEGIDKASAHEGPLAQVQDRELREAFRAALAELPVDQRKVVVLRGVEGLSFDEVARALGIPTPTAHSRMARACDRLRGLLSRFIEHNPLAAAREEKPS